MNYLVPPKINISDASRSAVVMKEQPRVIDWDTIGDTMRHTGRGLRFQANFQEEGWVGVSMDIELKLTLTCRSMCNRESKVEEE